MQQPSTKWLALLLNVHSRNRTVHYTVVTCIDHSSNIHCASRKMELCLIELKQCNEDQVSVSEQAQLVVVLKL